MVHLVKDPEGKTVMQSGAPNTIQPSTIKFKSSDPNKHHNDDEVIKLRQRLTEVELKLAQVSVHTQTHTHPCVMGVCVCINHLHVSILHALCVYDVC